MENPIKNNWNILIDNSTTEKALEDVVVQAIFAALETLSVKCKGEISLLFVGDDEMKEINLSYRGKDSTTDCLSFPQLAPHELNLLYSSSNFIILGDIITNIDAAKKQATEYGHTTQRELAFLAVHSLLHLLGYDHEGGKQAENEMFNLQEVILQKMGLARKGSV